MHDTNPTRTSNQGHDSTQDDYKFAFDPETDSVSEALLTAVSWLDGTNMMDLPVLNDYIDPDVLDDLFSPRKKGADRQPDCDLVFTYANYDVRVDSDGRITLIPSEFPRSK